MTSESKSTKYLAFGNSSHPVPRFLEPKRLCHKNPYMYSGSLAAFFVGSGLTSSSTHTYLPASRAHTCRENNTVLRPSTEMMMISNNKHTSYYV